MTITGTGYGSTIGILKKTMNNKRLLVKFIVVAG